MRYGGHHCRVLACKCSDVVWYGEAVRSCYGASSKDSAGIGEAGRELTWRSMRVTECRGEAELGLAVFTVVDGHGVRGRERVGQAVEKERSVTGWILERRGAARCEIRPGAAVGVTAVDYRCSWAGNGQPCLVGQWRSSKA
jgi:hypothetical protein